MLEAGLGFAVALSGVVGLTVVDVNEPINQAWLDADEWTVQLGDEVYPGCGVLRPILRPGNRRIQM